MNNVVAIVVTYNRKTLLQECLEALTSQSLMPSRILIIDNNSTDGTLEWLQASSYISNSIFTYLRLNENSGGAGGFSSGLKYAQENGYDWAWIMDDDARPQLNAFEKLMATSPTPNNIYGSIATCGENTSWQITLMNTHSITTTNKVRDIPTLAEVTFLPFLGLLIHSRTIEKIGLPDSDFFIAGDDLEYCLRARKAGLKIMVAGQSRIHHPKAEIHTSSIFGFKLDRLKIPPWKNYYNTRNKILIAKKYYGSRILTETLPGIIVRLFINLLAEPQKLAHIHAVAAGIFDGILGMKGKRHLLWKIKQ